MVEATCFTDRLVMLRGGVVNKDKLGRTRLAQNEAEIA